MSSRTDEDLIRRALERQSELAVPPDRIRAALPARVARRARQRRAGTAAVLVAATVAVVATVSIPVLGLGAGTPTEPAAPGIGASAPPVVNLPLRYRPTWLPSGFTERSRSGVAGPAGWVSQIWTKGSGDSELYTGGPRLELAVDRVRDGVDPLGVQGTEVTVNGRPGRLEGVPGGSEKSYLAWMPDAATVLRLSQVDHRLSKADLLRIARSVRPTPTVQRAPLRAGWLPTGLMLAPDLSILGNSTTFWQASLHAAPSAAPDAGTKAAGQEAESVVLSVGTVSAAPDGGERITVGGRPARFVTEVSAPKPPLIRSSVVVDLGAGMLLTVSGSSSAVGRADLVRIAEGARVDDDADLSWLGTR